MPRDNPSMLRARFQLIADVIAGSDSFETYSDRMDFAQEMANAFSTTNPNFDQRRFMDACEPPVEDGDDDDDDD
jgi:hypothetical protein